jgi:hypothetical protein
MKIQIFVMPAWMAGIRFARMPPETSLSRWIPALHAGMTEIESSAGSFVVNGIV